RFEVSLRAEGAAMRCWNCDRKIPPDAKICSHCEAPVTAAQSAEEIEAVRDILEHLPPEAEAELNQAFLDSTTAEEFADRILVGNCPKCDSRNTGNCENDPEISELLVGRCYDCGQFWCTECYRLLEPQAAV